MRITKKTMMNPFTYRWFYWFNADSFSFLMTLSIHWWLYKWIDYSINSLYFCLFIGIEFCQFPFRWKLYLETLMIILLCSVLSAFCTMSNVANIPSSENYTPVEYRDNIWDNCCWFLAMSRVSQNGWKHDFEDWLFSQLSVSVRLCDTLTVYKQLFSLHT